MFKWLKQNDSGTYEDFLINLTADTVALTELAIEIGANKISDVISKLGFRVTSNDDDQQKEASYIFNVKPNANQNATDFWKQVVMKMIKEPEGCLVVNLESQGLFIADSWQVTNMVISERTYYDVSVKVDGNVYRLNRSFRAGDVMHFRYSNPNLLMLLRKLDSMIDSTWSVVLNGIKAQAPKVKVSVPTTLRLTKKDGTVLSTNEYADSIAQALTSDEAKAIAAGKDVDIDVLDMKSNASTTDLSNLQKQIFDNVAMAMGIPLNIFYGELTSNTNADSPFITYACEPIISNMNDTIEGAYIDKEDYFNNGERIIINTLNVGHVDIIGNADKLDKLYSNGWTFNEVLEVLGQPRIEGDPSLDERRFTLNYSTLEGGETDE